MNICYNSPDSITKEMMAQFDETVSPLSEIIIASVTVAGEKVDYAEGDVIPIEYQGSRPDAFKFQTFIIDSKLVLPELLKLLDKDIPSGTYGTVDNADLTLYDVVMKVADFPNGDCREVVFACFNIPNASMNQLVKTNNKEAEVINAVLKNLSTKFKEGVFSYRKP
ncbi:MAG: hypothetical protein ACOYN2_03570 [Patescibacteria group bacterium]